MGERSTCIVGWSLDLQETRALPVFTIYQRVDCTFNPHTSEPRCPAIFCYASLFCMSICVFWECPQESVMTQMLSPPLPPLFSSFLYFVFFQAILMVENLKTVLKNSLWELYPRVLNDNTYFYYSSCITINLVLADSPWATSSPSLLRCVLKHFEKKRVQPNPKHLIEASTKKEFIMEKSWSLSSLRMGKQALLFTPMLRFNQIEPDAKPAIHRSLSSGWAGEWMWTYRFGPHRTLHVEIQR